MNYIYNKIKRNSLLIVSIFLSIFLFTTCNVGLGETVDILPPEVSITYPKNTAIIRDEFIMRGTVKDDFRVEAVTVSFTEKDALSHVAYQYSFDAIINTDNNTWHIEEVNKKITPDGIESPYPIKDGLYTVTAYATDVSGREHSYSLDYTIDNTAPVISMTTPGSDVSTTDYGNSIGIKGQVADDNIEKIEFTAYADASGTTEIASTFIDDVGGAIINTEIGRFSVPENFYNKIYGDTAGEKKVFYYTIQAFDSAKVYDGTENREGEEGNSSTEYYLTSDITALSEVVDANLIHSIRTESYYRTSATTIDEVKKAEATGIELSLSNIGKPATTKTSTTRVLAVNSLAASVKSNEVKLATFSLTPESSPTFSYSTAFTSARPPSTHNISSTSTLDISLHPNLDGSGHELDQFSIFVKELDGDGATTAIYQLYPLENGANKDTVESALESGVLTLTLPLRGVNIQSSILPSNESIVNPTDDPENKNYKHTPNEGFIGDLLTGSYLIEVVGSDYAEREYKNKVEDKYGFNKLSSSSLPEFDVSATFPTVTIIKPKPLNINSEPVVTIIGSVSTSRDLAAGVPGMEKIEWSLKINGSNEDEDEGDILYAGDEGFVTQNNKKYDFSIPLKHTHFFSPDSTKDYVLTLTATDSGGGTTTINRYITYDVEFPSITLTPDVSASSESSNTKILSLIVDAIDDRSVSGNSDDEGQSTTNFYEIGNKKTFFKAGSIENITITDTFTPNDIGLPISVTVQDGAGNVTTKTLTIDTIAPDLSDVKIINPTPPEPAVDPLSPDYEQTIDSNTINWYGNKVLTVSVDAKDMAPSGATAIGVATVEYNLSKIGETSSKWTTLNKGQDPTKPLEWTAIINPSDTGHYILSLRAIDENANVSEIETIQFSVDKTPPTVPKNYFVNDSEKLASLVTNATSDITVTLDGLINEDNAVVDSGFDVLKLTKIGTSIIDYEPLIEEGSDQKSNFLIPSSEIAKGTNGVVEFTIIDNVGNKTVYSPFSIVIDTEPPIVNITSPIQGEMVNGVVTVRGSTTDSYIATTVLQIKNISGVWENLADVSGRVWTYDIDTAKYANGTMNIRAVATDSAGNVGESHKEDTEGHIITIDQDEDRPIISITNATLNGMNNTTPAKLLSSQLRGSIADDDGIAKLEIATITVGSTPVESDFEEVSVLPGGIWVYPSNSILIDGPYNVYFRVTDTIGSIFTSIPLGANSSEEELQVSPKLTDGTDYFGYKDGGEKGSSLNLLVDTTPPEVVDIEINKTEGFPVDAWYNLTDNEPIRGSFKLRITAKDASRVVSIGIKNENTLITTTNTIADDENDIGTTEEIDSTTLTSGLVRLTIEATDGSGSVRALTRQILVDNLAPTLTAVNSHAYGSVVTGDVVLEGNASDGNNSSGIKSIHFAIPTKGASGNEWVNPEEKSVVEENDAVWKEVTGTNGWRIIFGTGGYATLSSYIGEDGGDYAIETSVGSNLWRLPLVFRLEDNLGNIGYTDVPPVNNAADGNNYFELHVDPNGNKPLVSVSYPKPLGSEIITLGGAITIFGSARDNEIVSAVFMQIDTDNDGNFDSDDSTNLSEKGYTIETIYPNADADGSDPIEWWGFKVEGTTNWKQVINTSDELNNSTIRYRVRSVDTSDAVSDWSDAITINIDENVPTIGESEPLTLVQYESDLSNTIIRQQPYEDGICLTGSWYLIGSIEDSAGISRLDIQGDISSNHENDSWFTPVSDFGSGTRGYRMNIPVSSLDANGALNFAITATKDTEGPTVTTSRSVFVNRDNTSPTASANLQSRDADIDDNNRVQQTDKTYTFGSTVIEAGGGLSHIAFWFERDVTGDSNDRIYNVMESRIGDANRTNLVRTAPTNGQVGMVDGLPKLRLTEGLTRESDATLKHSAIIGNLNVRRGGLVTIAGVDREITAVDYTSGVITFTPSADTSYTSADVAYVMLVNNQDSIETVREDGSIINDDGDGMLEYLERQGINYTWSASIDSRNIPDGPIKIHAVAYDMSGNKASHPVADSTVSNNAPAIAKVWLGTDLNGNNAIELNEETDYSTLSNNEPVTNAVIDASGATLKKFTATGLTHVIPEIVGGNGDLHYTLRTNGHSDINVDTAENTTRIREGDGSFTDGEAELERVDPIVLTVQDNMLLGTIPDTTAEAHTFNFTIWDSTEEAIVGGSGSQSATLELKMHIDVLDDVMPYTVVSPFYWTSEDDNSLYENSRDNGHIELDNIENPKVSGKVTISGMAFDDKSLREVWAKITDFEFDNATSADSMFKIAEYNPATASWVSDSPSIAAGWYFTAQDITFGQDGHSINWELHWDSQKMSGIVGTNKTITVIAKDASGNAASLTASGSVGEADYNNPSYTVDVVPYISSVSTAISRRKATNARTALGNYPVAVGEKDIEIHGFNFATDIANATLEIASTTIDLTSVNLNTVVFNLPTVSSGTVELTVNGMATINNSNKNVVYNMIPMANNDMLDDNVVFDVWEYETVAEKRDADIMDLELKIRPTDGNVGLAFVNNYYFNMPGSVSTNIANTYVSQRPYEYHYGPYWESALAFSPTGIPFGVSANQDKGSSIGSYVTLFAEAFQSDKEWNNEIGSYKKRFLGTGYGSDIRVQRLLSPVLAATNSGDTNYLYLAYYDTITKQLRYHWGSYNSSTKAFGGNFNYDLTSTTHILTTGRYDVITTLDNGIDYVSLDARNTTPGDIVVIIWYDKSNGSLKMVYNSGDSLRKSNVNTPSDRGWSEAITIDTNSSGLYNAVKIDAAGGIHIAYHTSKGLDLKYAYLSSVTATPQIVTVDSFGATGTQIRLDVAKQTAEGNFVPYISYYEGGTAKVAYQVNFSTESGKPALSGVENSKYNQNWEVSVVPTSSASIKNDSVNVGVWKDSSTDVQKAIPIVAGSPNIGVAANSFSGAPSTSNIGGNGTMNPVVAYINAEGNVEMAQKR